MQRADLPIHFIDFEGNTTSGIVEFGVVTIGGGSIVDARTRLCGAVGRVKPEDTAIHGLDGRVLATAAPFRDEWEYFARLRETGPMAAHFAGAENHLLKSVWPYPRSSPDFARPGAMVVEWGPWIDTGRLYPQLVPTMAAVKLGELIAATGLQAELDLQAARHCPAERRHYHAALYDALAGALLLLALLRQPQYAEATVPWLLQMSAVDGAKRDALQQGELF